MMMNKSIIHVLDEDPQETQEWLDSLTSVHENEGVERAQFLIERLIDHMRRSGAHLPYNATTAYVNTIATNKQQPMPGEPGIEHRIRSIIRWNALAIVVQANKVSAEYGGHIASFASAATLYDVGFNHFWRGPDHECGGDMVYIQGHSSPGIYARAFLEGRLTEDQLRGFRREVENDGLSSYPHPWLMPGFWQFPTVSMGLTSLLAIYQARFLKYLENREITPAKGRKVWAFMGDGEMDEPESRGAISLAAREELDNLVFVINCNLQRLDGPVRGNGKIIQELEGDFRGAGWNVIKVVWGDRWDPLLAKDKDGLLLKRMEEALDGDYQNYKNKGGAYTRENFFGKDPKLLEMVADLSDDDIWALNRGGHDPQKVYAAYHEAVNTVGKPTVILAKTVKGYGLGEIGEGAMTSHSAKKMQGDSIRRFRDRYRIPVPDDQVEDAPFYRPDEDSAELQYLRERRTQLGGYLPARRENSAPLEIPELELFGPLLAGSGDREISTTMAFVRILTLLLRDKKIGKNIVPIVPDEARTFGMEGLFRTIGIYSSVGQLYDPVDADQVMFYREDKQGQILQEGISEAGAMASWIAAATAYSNHDIAMIPFYIYYSMFGFQRIGDLAWAAGDMQARGFLLGGTAGRTTLAGEGLQHQDGHTHLAASTIPNCVAYDPAFAYELAVIIHDGLRRMYVERERIFYYVTVMNENYQQPAMPEGDDVSNGILRGMHKIAAADPGVALRVQLLGSGAILREVLSAAEILKNDFDVSADVWSVTSFTELRRDGLDIERWNMLHPEAESRKSFCESSLESGIGPVIATTDYMKVHAEQIRPFIPGDGANYTTLGTDGYGRSDSRKRLRYFFEVNDHFIVIATLKALSDRGEVSTATVHTAMQKFEIDPEKPNPVSA
jgi:pyruvate dehydrogenase E1 component